MKLVWAVPADKDREHLIFYIAQDNVDAAIEMDMLFDKTADSLLAMPEKGRIGRVEGTRELVVHPNYILVYGYDAEVKIVFIVAVLHASRQYPPL